MHRFQMQNEKPSALLTNFSLASSLHQGTGLSSSNVTEFPFSSTQIVKGSDPICSVLNPSEFQIDPGTATRIGAAHVLFGAGTVTPVMTWRVKSILYNIV
jgi:hypothetical protein